MWNTINTEKDIKYLMEQVCEFHDACIKEMIYYSGAYVTEELSMYPVNEQREVRLIILRQDENIPAVELDFQDIVFFYVSPTSTAYTCEILGARLYFKDERIYWSNSDDPITMAEKSDSGVVICAKRMKWRIISHRGSQKYYQTNQSVD